VNRSLTVHNRTKVQTKVRDLQTHPRSRRLRGTNIENVAVKRSFRLRDYQ
jgi:hypothetical protein